MKKILCILLSALLVLSAAGGCLAEATDYKAIYADRVGYVVDNFASWAEANGVSEYLKPYDEPLTVTMVHNYNNACETMIGKLGDKYGENYSSNRWTEIMKK